MCGWTAYRLVMKNIDTYNLTNQCVPEKSELSSPCFWTCAWVWVCASHHPNNAIYIQKCESFWLNTNIHGEDANILFDSFWHSKILSHVMHNYAYTRTCVAQQSCFATYETTFYKQKKETVRIAESCFQGMAFMPHCMKAKPKTQHRWLLRYGSIAGNLARRLHG